MEERLAALEARIRELENAPRKPMRDTLQCPMCGERTILRSTALPRDWVLMNLGSQGGLFKREVAPCSAHGCAACGFVEFHADFKDVDLEKSDIETLVGEEASNPSPYR